MPNLVLSNIQIKKLDASKNRFNPETPYYVVAECMEEDNFFAEPVTVSLLESRHKALVSRIRQHYPKGEKYNGSNDALSEEGFNPIEAEEKMDKRLKELPNSIVVKQYLGGPYLAKYNQDIIGPDGAPIPDKKKDDWVKTRDGRIKVYTHREFPVAYGYQWVDVFRDGKLQKVPKTDETGMPIMFPMKGFDPEEQAKDYRERFLFPLSELTAEERKKLPDEYQNASFGQRPQAEPKAEEETAPNLG